MNAGMSRERARAAPDRMRWAAAVPGVSLLLDGGAAARGRSVIVPRRIASILSVSPATGFAKIRIADPPDRVSLLRDGAIDGFGTGSNRAAWVDLPWRALAGLTREYPRSASDSGYHVSFVCAAALSAEDPG
jgi:hypothetical protein